MHSLKLTEHTVVDHKCHTKTCITYTEHFKANKTTFVCLIASNMLLLHLVMHASLSWGARFESISMMAVKYH